MFAFLKLSLTRQFMLFALLVMVGGLLVIGLWVGEQIREGVLDRTAAVTSVYVNSLIAHHLEDLQPGQPLSEATYQEFEEMVNSPVFKQHIVSVKLWEPSGRILYSPDPQMIGLRFGNARVQQAIDDAPYSSMSDLERTEHRYERSRWDRLIETYVPIYDNETGDVIAVVEYYQDPDALLAEIRAARFKSWLVVGAATLLMYLLLYGLVGQASRVILKQRTELEDHVRRLNETLEQNRALDRSIRMAAARTTALNEQFLHRLSADLHDGPAQTTALALLRFGTLTENCAGCPGQVNGEIGIIQSALQSALDEVRAISAGLRLPQIDSLSLHDTARRAIRDFERLTGQSVTLHAESLPDEAPLSVRITVFRLLQEALGNSYKHTRGVNQEVRLSARRGELLIAIADDGPGFEPPSKPKNGSLGLVGMGERVRVLGGKFEVQSAPGAGTTIHASLPLEVMEADDG